MVKGLGRAKRTLRHVKRQFRPVGVILMYHRIIDTPVDPRGTAVSPENFAQHLEYVQKTCTPIRLLDLVDALRGHSVPRRAVAVTFDDGHASVLGNGYPSLASARVPATAFITTGNIDDPRDYWWDELDRILLLPDRLPESLVLCAAGREHRWDIGGQQKRLEAYSALHRLARQAPRDERETMLSYLSTWAGVDRKAPSDCRPMTRRDLEQLAQDDLIDLGAHTVTHPSLATLPAGDQHAEVLDSRSCLEGIVGRPVEAFAYPYGQAEHFAEETVHIVQEAGFSVACTAIQGLVEPGDNPFQLHRCEIRNWDIAAFKKHLEWLFTS